MKSPKAIFSLPLGGPARISGERPSRLPGRATLAALLISMPGLLGCPGHLEDESLIGDGRYIGFGNNAQPGGQPDSGLPAVVLPPPQMNNPAPVMETPKPAAANPTGGAPAVPECSTPASILANILTPQCGGCHGAMAPKGQLDLVSPGAKARLLNIASKGMNCGGKPLIVDSPAVGGVLFDKLAGKPPAGCGMPMPFMKPALTPEQIVCLKDWIKPGAGSAGPAPDAALCSSPAEINSKILAPKCAVCHTAVAPQGGLDLTSPGAKARLLNIPSKAAACGKAPLVVDSPAVAGVLFDKLAGTAAMGCGVRMPPVGAPLSAAEIQCMKDWIKAPAAGGADPVGGGGMPMPMPTPVATTPACASPAEITSKILVPACGACHGAVMPASNLDLVSPGAKARLVGKPSVKCNGQTLVVADPVPSGFFFDKISGPVPAGCGMLMPYVGTMLNATEIKCLKDWIKPTP
jgi:hypothetical protein